LALIVPDGLRWESGVAERERPLITSGWYGWRGAGHAGLIFLGDGGADFLGFWFAELSILLLVRSPGEVSPLFP
jgi:hypothetical protein